MNTLSKLYAKIGLAALVVVLSFGSLQAQPENDDMANALEIEDLLHWCSPLA